MSAQISFCFAASSEPSAATMLAFLFGWQSAPPQLLAEVGIWTL
jgi:hypothetical protein